MGDIKYSNQLGEGKKGFQLAFVFGENPYFSDKVLTKTYLLDPDDEDECLSKAIGSNIAWKEGKSTCVRMNTKTQKKKGKTRAVTWFTGEAVDPDEDYDDDDEEDSDEDDDEDEDESEDDDDEESDSDDEAMDTSKPKMKHPGAAPGGAAADNPECKQQ